MPEGVKLIIDKAVGEDNGELTAKGGGNGAGIGGYQGSAGNIYINGGIVRAEPGANGGAGIGGGTGGSGGNIRIIGGTVTAMGYYPYPDDPSLKKGQGAGIGSGKEGSGGAITIEGGIVYAEGAPGSAGIGGGLEGTSGTITIKGGEVVAVGGTYVSGRTHGGGAGIGGGAGKAGGNITIEGGTVTATGGTGSYTDSTIVSAGAGAGIGGGGGSQKDNDNSTPGGSGGIITIKGGLVIAEGGSVLKSISQWNSYLDNTSGLGGAGIGGGGGSKSGIGGSGGSIIIEDGTVEAIGASGGAGIGGGKQNAGGNIIIEGGIVTASGSYLAAGIGGGGNNKENGGSWGNITISGGEVGTVGGIEGAGIGGGTDGGSGGVITIEGGLVKAQGSSGSAGIGGGRIGNGGTITIINNPTVIATGTDGAADIGNGLNCTGSTILKDALDNDLSYIRLAVTYRSAKKPDVTVTMNDIDYITNEDGLTGFFVQENSTQSIGIKADDLNIDTEITMDFPPSQSIRKTIELSYYRADLTKLLLSKGTLEPEFSSDQTSYTVNVGYSISTITVNPTAEATSSIKVDGITIANGTNSPSISLKEGNNEVEIVVTAGDGVTQKTYFLNIVRRPQILLSVNGSFTAEDKEYDGNVEAVIDSNNLILTGIVGDDDVALNAVVAFDDSQVSEAKTVRLTEASSLIGAQAGDYLLSLTEAPTAKAKIIPKKLTVINAVAQDKVYNGTTHAEISGAELSGGVVEGDEILLSNYTSGEFAQSGVGSDISVLTEMSLTGDDKGNYTLEQPSLTGNIMAKELTVINAVAQDKIYDGTTRADISGAKLVGLVGTDDVEIDASTGTFAMKNAGMNITVTPELTLKGIDKDNYVLIQPMGLKANIIPKELTVINVVAQNKVYDGTTHAEIRNAGLNGVVEGDDVLLENKNVGTFAQSNVGTGIGVHTEMTVSGRDGGNYFLIQPGDLSADIIVRPLTITADSLHKTYGEIDPELTYQITEGQLVDSDCITGELTRVAGDNAGSYAIEQGSLTAGTNYNITFVGAELTIERKVLTITVENKNKIYGAVDPIFTVTYDGFITGEDEKDLAGDLFFIREESEEPGQYKITPSGQTSINYLITFVDGTLNILSNNADLSNMALSNLTQGNLNLSPVFDPDITSYTVDVRNSVSRVTITAVSDHNATITVNTIPVASGEASDAISLKVGPNIITVLVTAEDEKTTKTYTITINRSRQSSGGNNTSNPNQPELESKMNDKGEKPEISRPEAKVISLVLGERVTTVDGMSHILDAAPFVKPGVNRTLVPVRFLSEMLGARVQWQAETQQIIIVHGDNEIVITIGSDKVLVNGNTIILDCPAELLSSGRAFVPLRFVSEALGSEVHWDDAAKTITIM